MPQCPPPICTQLSHVHSEAERRPAHYSRIHPSTWIKTKGDQPKPPSKLSPVKTLRVEGKPHEDKHNVKIGISHNSATNSYLTPYLKCKSSDASLIWPLTQFKSVMPIWQLLCGLPTSSLQVIYQFTPDNFVDLVTAFTQEHHAK